MPKNKTKKPPEVTPEPEQDDLQSVALARVDQLQEAKAGLRSLATELGLDADSGPDAIEHVIEKLKGRDVDAEGGANVVPTGMTLAETITADRKRMQDMEAELRAVRMALDRIRQALRITDPDPTGELTLQRASKLDSFRLTLRGAAAMQAKAGDAYAYGLSIALLKKFVGEAAADQLLDGIKLEQHTGTPAGDEYKSIAQLRDAVAELFERELRSRR